MVVVSKNFVSDEDLTRLQDWARKLIKDEKLAEILDAVIIEKDFINKGEGQISQGGIEFWKGELQRTENCLGDNPLVLDNILKSGIALYGPQASKIILPLSEERMQNAIKKELKELRNGLNTHFENDMGYRYYFISLSLIHI